MEWKGHVQRGCFFNSDNKEFDYEASIGGRTETDCLHVGG